MGRLLLTNGNVLLEDGPPTGATVVIDGDRIVEVSRGETPPTSGTDRVVDLAGRTLMPGMHICHFHACFFNPGTGLPYGCEIPPAYQAIVCAHNLDLALAAGYTGVVSAGGPNEVEAGVKQAIEAGWIEGPRFVPCSRELSTTGHANDAIPWYWEMPRVGGVHICDGADGFRLGVRQEIRRGAEIIKLFVTGGHLVPRAPDRMEMTRDELAAAIDAAHQRHVPIRGHVVGKEGILLSVELGMDIIDHCDEMDDECVAALVENKTFVVPSIYYLPIRAAFIEAAQPELAASLRQDAEKNLERLAKAEAAGVRLVLGDDYSSRGMPHGTYLNEICYYVEEAGISPLSVLGWATKNGAELAGRGHDLGTIAPGKLADLLVIDGDPSKDIRNLTDNGPAAVLKGGKVVKGELAGV